MTYRVIKLNCQTFPPLANEKEDFKLLSLLRVVNTCLSKTPKFVSPFLLDCLKEAIHLGSVEAAWQLADIIIGTKTSLSFEEKLKYLAIAADYNHPSAAYKCGMGYLGKLQGELKQRTPCQELKGLSYLLKAAELNDPLATHAFLCVQLKKDQLLIRKNPKMFESLCLKFIEGKKNSATEAALIYGQMLCGFSPSEQLSLPLHFPRNSKKGLFFLYFALAKGSHKIKEEARSVITQCIRKNLKDSDLKELSLLYRLLNSSSRNSAFTTLSFKK